MQHETGLIARARGLLQHLVPRATLEVLAEAVDLPGFARGVARLGADVGPVAEPWDLAAFERAIRQTAARHLATLARWQQAEVSAIDIVTDDIDRRSVRRLIRGAMQGAPEAVRLDGLTPTPRLPERVLTELARQPSPTAVVGLLAAVGHPDAGMLAPLVARTQPELFAIDRALLAGWSSRAARTAGRDPVLRELVELRVDLGNAQTALLLATGPRDADPSRAHVPGGRTLTKSGFTAAASATTIPDALTALRRSAAGTPLSHLLPAIDADVDAMERRYLAHVLEHIAVRARQEPIATATLMSTLLRLEAQGRDLRALAWGAMFGVPPLWRKRLLVTPWA